jgi:ubiquinone/menaquinone biosynthesis C-methylase UbiE
VLERDWASVFSETFRAPSSAVQARIWTEVLGDEYPASLDTYSFVTVSELNRCLVNLTVPAGGVLGDFGCGRGGPGLWIASQTGSRLVGIDIADTAVAAARERARDLGLSESAAFHIATFEATGLATDSLDGAISIDALLFSPDKAAAISEFARVLRDGARLLITTWDYHSQPIGRPPQVEDHRPLLEAAGFSVLVYDEPESWRERQNLIDELLLQAVDELAAENDLESDAVHESIVEMHATLSCVTRRVFVVAERVS